MDWLSSLFSVHSSVQTVIIISLVVALGLALGRIKVMGVSLGIAFVFFAGILAGHAGLSIDARTLDYVETFGLSMFVYCLGLHVGPNFFGSLRHEGMALNLWGLAVILAGTLLALVLVPITGVGVADMVGLLCGATTNTPALGAATQALEHLGIPSGRAALATAVTYPLGVVGVILAMMRMRKLFVKPCDLKVKPLSDDDNTYIAQLTAINPAIDGKTIAQIAQMTHLHFIISRIWRGDTLIIPSSQTVLHEGDHLLVLVHPEDVEEMEQFFGRRAESRDWNRPDIDWDAIDSQLVSKRIIITNSKVNGAKLGALRLRNQYGINITRIDRAGIEILATPDLHLQLGDRLSVVGEAQEIERASKFLGDSINVLDKPKLFSFFFGLAVGCILGSIPLAIPGLSMPIKLGLAGGPIIVGILMGAFGARLRIATYMSNSATQLIKQLGIILYLAGLGLASGEHFFEMIIHGDGLLWIGLGFLITYLPTMAVGLLSLFGYKKTHAETVGMLCGVMANSMALDYAMSINESRSSSVAYAIVYPVGMFVRIISAQILLSFFL